MLMWMHVLQQAPPSSPLYVNFAHDRVEHRWQRPTLFVCARRAMTISNCFSISASKSACVIAS